MRPLTICGGKVPDYPPVVVFELSRDVGDLHTIFCDKPSKERDAVVAEMSRNTRGDSFVFIPLYGAFMIFFFLGARGAWPRLARIGLALSALAILSDYAENYSLFQTLGALDNRAGPYALLPWATGVKWVSLGLGGIVCAFASSTHRLVAATAAALAVVGLALVLLALIDPHAHCGLAPFGILVSWGIFLIADAWESFRLPA